MTIDIAAIKPGDEIVFQIKAVWEEKNAPDPAYSFTFTEAELETAEIVGHTPRALQVGDRVRFASNPNSSAGDVLALDNGWAWVRFTTSYSATDTYLDSVKATSLVRVSP